MDCTACGCPGAYVGMNVVECPRAGCRHYSAPAVEGWVLTVHQQVQAALAALATPLLVGPSAGRPHDPGYISVRLAEPLKFVHLEFELIGYEISHGDEDE